MSAPRYLLDTNICIYVAKRRPPEVLRRFDQLPGGAAAISIVTWGELLFGAEKSSKRDAALATLEELRTVLPVLPLTEAVGTWYGKIRAELERRGRPIGGNDLWIAAHAHALGLVLVTNNAREFERIDGLSVESWVAA